MTEARRPRASSALLVLLLVFGLLSLSGALSPEHLGSLLLDSARVREGGALWGFVTYWLFPPAKPPTVLLLAVLALFLFGVALERALGAARLLAIFFAGLLVGGLVFVATVSDGKLTAGATPGAMALAGAAVVASLRGQVPQRPGGWPLWMIALVFLGGEAWIFASMSQLPLAALTFLLAPAALGALLARLSPSMPRG